MYFQEFKKCAFRANPDYQLVSGSQRHDLLFNYRESEVISEAQIQKSLSDNYAFLVPKRGSTMNTVSINRETAELFAWFKRARSLPEGLEASHSFVVDLVLNGILEVSASNRYISGPAVCNHLLDSLSQLWNSNSHIGQLSINGIKLAQALPMVDSNQLATWLYNYGREPVSREWVKRIPNKQAFEKFLGLQRNSPIQVALEKEYIYYEVEGWHAWRHQESDIEHSLQQLTYKLYVSPKPIVFASLLPLITQCFSDLKVPSFKIGKDVFGILRPDKLVAYFDNIEDLLRAAIKLKRAIGHYPAQAVPFSATLTDSGLLSWAIDPPVEKNQSEQLNIQSWRSWVTTKLARSILQAKSLEQESLSMEPWKFALLHLKLMGVDINNWVASESMWGNE